MDKTLKKQIKQDELVTGVEHAQAWLSGHGEEVRATLIGVALLVVVGGGLLWYRGHRAAESRRAFEAALEVYQAPVGPSADESASLSFSTEKEKHTQALAAFQGVADRFGSLPQGLQAQYYAGLCRIELGQLDEAQSSLSAVAEDSDGAKGAVLSSLAQLALARIERQRGQLDKAIEIYQKLAEKNPSALPKDAVLSALGETLEEAGRLPEAAATFRRLVEEYPTSTYASQARLRADSLKLAAAG